MRRSREERLRELVVAAVDIDPAERRSFLLRACGRDERLVDDALRLVDAYERARRADGSSPAPEGPGDAALLSPGATLDAPLEARTGAAGGRWRRGRWLAAGAVLLVVGAAGVGVVVPRWRAAQAERARVERQGEAERLIVSAQHAIDRASRPGQAGTPEAAAATREAGQLLAQLRPGFELEAALLPRASEAFRRLADLTAGTTDAGRPALETALAQYGEALRLLDAVGFGADTARAAARTRARTRAGRARLLAVLGRHDEARAELLRAEPDARALAGRPARDPSDVDLLASIGQALGDAQLDAGDPKGALARYDEAASLLAEIGEGTSADPRRQRALTQARLRAARVRASLGDLEAARGSYAAAAGRVAELDAGVPWSESLTRDLSLGLVHVGSLRERGADRKGRGDIQAGIRLLRDRARRDTGDVQVQRDFLGSLVTLGDVLVGDNPERAREAYREAWAVADTLVGAAAPDPGTAQTLRAVESKLRSGPAAWIPRPRIELLPIGEGAPAAFGPDASVLQAGDELEVRTKTPAGTVGYLLLFGARGAATLLGESQMQAVDGRITLEGPPPSQTILLLASSRPLSREDRAALLAAIGQVAGPRTVPGPVHLRWRDGVPVATQGGAASPGAASLDWTVAVRRVLGRFPQIAYAGHSFPLSAPP